MNDDETGERTVQWRRHPPLDQLMQMEIIAFTKGGRRLSLTDAFRDLLACGYVPDPDTDRASLFLGSGRDAARRIGMQVSRRAPPGYTGHEMMVALHDAVAQALSAGAARELEAAWHGVGDWRD